MKMNQHWTSKIWNNREKIVAYGLFLIFGIGISLIYLSVVTTIADVSLTWFTSQQLDPSYFTVKGVEFVLGATLLALGFGFLGWIILIYVYNRLYWKVASLLEFIDTNKRIRDEE